MRLILLYIVCLLALPAVCLAVPTISGVTGTVANGESITITSGASDFGANGPTVSLFDDFELGTSGEGMLTGSGSAQVGQWDSVDDSTSEPTYESDFTVSGSLAYNADNAHYSMGLTHLMPDVTEVFASWWIYFDGASIPASNWKTTWFQGQDSYDDDLSVPTHLTTGSWVVDGNDNVDPNGIDYSGFYDPTNRWVRAWVHIIGTTDGTGVLEFWWINATGVYKGSDETDFQVFMADNDPDSTYAFERVIINANASFSTNSIAYDDVYVAYGQYAQARIEIGNNATYANCTDITVVTPTSWSAGSVTGVVREGRFDTDDTGYVYVFDSDGVANATGYEVTFGAASSDPVATLTGATLTGATMIGD